MHDPTLLWLHFTQVFKHQTLSIGFVLYISYSMKELILSQMFIRQLISLYTDLRFHDRFYTNNLHHSALECYRQRDKQALLARNELVTSQGFCFNTILSPSIYLSPFFSLFRSFPPYVSFFYLSLYLFFFIISFLSVSLYLILPFPLSLSLYLPISFYF